MMGFKVVIPARYGSTRLPGKPLVDICGKPMIQHVHERALDSGAEEVIVTTDDARVGDAARGFGARVVMTPPSLRSGTERVAAACAEIGVAGEAIVVNLQGDEPLIPPSLVAQVAGNLAGRPEVDIATLCEPIEAAHAVFDPSVVKVVRDRDGRALYFSRAPIPWYRDAYDGQGAFRGATRHFRHIGLYAYRAAYLVRYVGEPQCELETSESLEQLRALFCGSTIHVDEAVEDPGPGVDTRSDLEQVRALVARAGSRG